MTIYCIPFHIEMIDKEISNLITAKIRSNYEPDGKNLGKRIFQLYEFKQFLKRNQDFYNKLLITEDSRYLFLRDNFLDNNYRVLFKYDRKYTPEERFHLKFKFYPKAFESFASNIMILNIFTVFDTIRVRFPFTTCSESDIQIFNQIAKKYPKLPIEIEYCNSKDLTDHIQATRSCQYFA